MNIVLASTSETRRRLLYAAGVPVTVEPSRLDEESVMQSLLASGTAPREIADALAEAKALKVAGRRPQDLVIGCDQVLALDGTILVKPADREAAKSQLEALSGRRHTLHSAVVACEAGAPIWRHVGMAHLTMRRLGSAHVEAYVAAHWDEIRHCVGSYQLEGQGMRFFTEVRGDYFTVLGLPMLPLLSWLIERGDLPS